MNLRQFSADGRLKRHQSSLREVRDLLGVVDRDLHDAAVEAISVDRRFQIAYQAALQLATIVLAASGYRTTGKDHHWVTFRVLPELLGAKSQELAAYFDQCRGQRNRSDYDRAGEIADHEAIELLQESKQFRRMVLAWLRQHHPKLIPP